MTGSDKTKRRNEGVRRQMKKQAMKHKHTRENTEHKTQAQEMHRRIKEGM